MSSTTSRVANKNSAGMRYPSLGALQAAHNDLLKRQRQDGGEPVFRAAVTDFLRAGTATGAQLDDDADRRTVQSILDYWAARLFRLGEEPPDTTLAEFDPLLAPELPDALCPYLGLDAFREDDHDKFYGRRRLVAELVERLAHQRLLAVVGPSGSGKSSLVRAGLLPALKSGALPGSQDWRYLPPIVPGPDPLAALSQVLPDKETRRPGDKETGRQGDKETGRPGDKETAFDPLLVSVSPCLLVVDQFEELFTLCDDEAARQAFIARLLELAEAPGLEHHVILTMRSDFETFVTRVPALQELFERGRVQVTPFSAGELREAIEQPAAAVGLKFEAGVVDALLQDLLGEPAALPLLQFTLLKLWENRERNRVTWAAYQKVGGGRLALARSADAFYAALIPEEQTTARRILLRMVRPGEGLEITSSRIRRHDLYRGGEDPGRIERVLAKLVAARLVRLTSGETPGDDQVEVAHEALVRNWPALVDWLEEEKVALATRRRLEGRAAEWVRLGRSSGGLLDEIELRQAERWLAGPEAAYLGYEPALADLVAASRAALAAAVEKQRLAYQRLRLLTFGLIVALIGVLIATGVAFWQRNDATQEAIARTTAEANAQSHAATAEVESQKAQAALALLVAQSNTTTPTPASVATQIPSSAATQIPSSAATPTPGSAATTAPSSGQGPPVFVGTVDKVTNDPSARCGTKNSSSIYGRVEDRNGKGVANAKIRVSDQNGKNVFNIPTDQAGSFLVTTLGCTTWHVDLMDVPKPGGGVRANQIVVDGLNGGQLSSAQVRFRQQ